MQVRRRVGRQPFGEVTVEAGVEQPAEAPTAHVHMVLATQATAQEAVRVDAHDCLLHGTAAVLPERGKNPRGSDANMA